MAQRIADVFFCDSIMEAVMDKQNTATSPQTHNTIAPSAFALEWFRLCQTPLVLSTAWWNAAMAMAWPPRDGKHVAADPHAQLVVPDPIEKDGEHALVA